MEGSVHLARPDASQILQLREADNVAVALVDLREGETVNGLAVQAAIPRGHKIALRPVAAGEAIIKYERVIGMASRDIPAGAHVHIHNMSMPDGGPVDIGSGPTPKSDRGHLAARTFMGIVRPDGRVATRNYVGILTTVNCSATVARAIADRYKGEALKRWPGMDGVIALTHGHGCALGHDSDGLVILRRALAGYAHHPNFAGVLLLGLGCESNALDKAVAAYGGVDERLAVLDVQRTGGTLATIEQGCAIIERLLDRAADVTRQSVPISRLAVGLQCGGSDGFSGISANPALGYAADLLVQHGGTVILSETPEIYGAEHLLTSRAISKEVADKLEAHLAWWSRHAALYGGALNDNPSAGNIAGGITNIVEKSLGAAAKAGSSPLTDVIPYAAPLTGSGLIFMDSPGYDPVAVTGQVASGANLIAFTTGRGSTFGCKPVPSLKIASNSGLYARMSGDMDINAGDILEGSVSVAEKGVEIFETLLATASGQSTASERLGFGEAEFAPWVPGAVT